MKIKLSIILFFLSTTFGFAQFVKGDIMINGVDLPYQVSYPDNYDASKQYPLIIFLHGAGERGNDNEAELAHGKEFLAQTQSKFPAIVVAPQCPNDSYWSNVRRNDTGKTRLYTFGVSDEPTQAMKVLQALVTDWVSSGLVDTKRVYLGGLSMGGMGTYELLWRMPNTFAAAFAICGGGDPSKVSLYAKNTAVWIFHGEADSVVPPHFSKQMYDALKAAGCDVKYTTYPNVDHNSWDNAFQEQNLLPWIFNHSK